MKALYRLLFLVLPITLFAQEENITFPSGNINMRGTLAIPQGDGPFPAVILVHGSGQNDRDQTATLSAVGAIPCLYPQLVGETLRIFKDISDSLSANGIAVLRYDKRSFSHPTSLDPVFASTNDFIRDIENALAWLKTRPEIDTDCIVLAGQSQGGALITGLKTGTEDVAGLISLAGAATPADTLIIAQIKDQFVRCANSPTCGDLVATSGFNAFAPIRNGTFDPNTQVTIENQFCNFIFPLGFPTFWKDWMDLGDSIFANYARMNVPTLIIQGKDDFNVPWTDAVRFENELDSDLTQVHIFDDINHFLTPPDDPHVAPEILNLMIDWIKNVKASSSTQSYPTASEIRIFQNGGKLIVESAADFDHIQISSLSGNVIWRKPIENQKRVEISLSGNERVVIVSLFDESQVIGSRKVFLK